MRRTLSLVAASLAVVLMSGCTVIKTVDKPWPVMPKPDRPTLSINRMDFGNNPPSEREYALIQDIFNTTAYAEALEAGIAVYNHKAAEHNSKVLEQMGKISQVEPHKKVEPKKQPAHLLDGPSDPELDETPEETIIPGVSAGNF